MSDPMVPKFVEAIRECAESAAARQKLDDAHPNVEADVREFHELIEAPTLREPRGKTPYEVLDLRRELIHEESVETLNAINTAMEEDDPTVGQLAEIADGCIDTIVVCLGTLDALGLPFAPLWREIHRTNMAKGSGPVREDGKRLKPEGWTPPDLVSIVRGAMEGRAQGDGDVR